MDIHTIVLCCKRAFCTSKILRKETTDLGLKFDQTDIDVWQCNVFQVPSEYANNPSDVKYVVKLYFLELLKRDKENYL